MQYCHDHLYMDFNISKMMNSLISKHDLDEAEDPFDAMPALPQRAPPAARNDASLINEFAEKMLNVELNEGQRAFLNTILANPKGWHCLSGAPGSGKTFMTQLLTHRLRAGGKVVLLSAMTGAAAVRLSAYASTAHHNLYIPVNRKDWWTDLDPGHPLFAVIDDADAIIIDEASVGTSWGLHVHYYTPLTSSNPDK